MGLTAYMSVVAPLSSSLTLHYCITTNGRIPVSERLQAASGKRKFQPNNRNGCEKCNDSNDDEWFLGFDEKGKDIYMKLYKVLIELLSESKDKKKYEDR